MCIKSKQMYQALRYESSGELIIKGPVPKPDETDKEILQVLGCHVWLSSDVPWISRCSSAKWQVR